MRPSELTFGGRKVFMVSVIHASVIFMAAKAIYGTCAAQKIQRFLSSKINGPHLEYKYDRHLEYKFTVTNVSSFNFSGVRRPEHLRFYKTVSSSELSRI